MMQTVEKFSTSARPEAIWEILADVERWPTWTPTVTSIEPLSAGGLRVGAKYRVSQPKLRPAVYEVTACAPNEAFTWVQRLPGGELIAEHRISAKDGRSEVELSFRSKGWLAGLVGALFSKTIREYVATEARSLKQKCESA
jgi:carbon monoxide dehydrogenase subunit G